MLNLQYIYNETRRFKVFVGNRISEIQEYTSSAQWRFVPGKLNPSDLATRGTELTDENELRTWLHGPEFLLMNETEWPKTEVAKLVPEDVEVRNNLLQSDATPKQIADESLEMDVCNFATLVNYERLSSWRKLTRIFGWIRVFLNNCKNKNRIEDASRELSLEEEKTGRFTIIRLMQQASFG